MAYVTVRPLEIDRTIADKVSSHTDRQIEKAARIATWGADEHVLAAVAAVGWLVSRSSTDEAVRRFATHTLVCSLATAALPHLLKRIVDQKRPDRETVTGHLRGIPVSGNANDAFPSGHALHVGAIASAATFLPPSWRNTVWAGSAALVTTRVVLLAHWTSDVIVGLILGAALERGLRLMTKPVRVRR